MRPLLADPALEPGPSDIDAAADRAAELLRVEASSPLFRLAAPPTSSAGSGSRWAGPSRHRA